MVNILLGQKGSGKTQKMMELANEKAKSYKGNVVFIKHTHHDTKNVGFNIRVVCMDDYPVVNNTDSYIGFLYGMYSANLDTECVFIDGLLKYEQINMEDVPGFITKLKQLSGECGVDYYVSLSASKADLVGEAFEGCAFVE